MPRIAPVAVAQKRVDSSSVSQKACPALVFERWDVEKLRKALEKKAVVSGIGKAKSSAPVNASFS
jgi:hypothetical protein